jgi:hypothetical protein
MQYDKVEQWVCIACGFSVKDKSTLKVDITPVPLIRGVISECIYCPKCNYPDVTWKKGEFNAI